MAKFNKDFNEIKFQELDRRLRENVMTNISSVKPFRLKSFFKTKYFALILTTLVIGLFFSPRIFNPSSPNVPNPPVDADYVVNVEAISKELLIAEFVTSSFLSNPTTAMNNNNLVKLSNTTSYLAVDTEFENRLTEFNSYVTLLDTFMDGSIESVDSTLIETPDEDYIFHLTYNLNGEDYQLDYNVFDSHNDESLTDDYFLIKGIMIYDGTTYEIIGGLEDEDGSKEIWMETIGSSTTTRIEIESNELEYSYEIERFTGNTSIYYEIRYEKDGADGAFELYIEENGVDSYYEITKEIDSPFTIYYFDYSIGDTWGAVTLMIYYDDGIEVKYYIIEEGDSYKEILIPDNATHPDDM